MARKYTTVSELGRCVVLLRGVHVSGQCRARLVRTAFGDRVYVVVDKSGSREIVPITSMEPIHLLRGLNLFTWEFAVDIEQSE